MKPIKIQDFGDFPDVWSSLISAGSAFLRTELVFRDIEYRYLDVINKIMVQIRNFPLRQ
jgi:hypothetical protein